MKRVVFKHSEDNTPLTWRIVEDYKPGMFVPLMVCDIGHESILRTHRVDENGDVTPSSVCPVDGCPFHEFATLEGWSEHGILS